MKYENIKERSEKQQEYISPESILNLVSPFCRDNSAHELVMALTAFFELNYRLGFVRGTKEKSEESIRAEFDNREFQLHTQLRQWLKNTDDELYIQQNNSAE